MLRVVGVKTRNANLSKMVLQVPVSRQRFETSTPPDARLERYHYTNPRLRKVSKLKTGLGSKLYPSLNESCGHRTTSWVCYCISCPNERGRLRGQSEPVVTTSCGPALQPAEWLAVRGNTRGTFRRFKCEIWSSHAGGFEGTVLWDMTPFNLVVTNVLEKNVAPPSTLKMVHMVSHPRRQSSSSASKLVMSRIRLSGHAACTEKLSFGKEISCKLE